MNFERSDIRMRTPVEKIRPLPGGKSYEAKVTNLYGPDGKEILHPQKNIYWSGIFWGHTSQEAQQKAENDAFEALKKAFSEKSD